jgi:hypothetical protein
MISIFPLTRDGRTTSLGQTPAFDSAPFVWIRRSSQPYSSASSQASSQSGVHVDPAHRRTRRDGKQLGTAPDHAEIPTLRVSWGDHKTNVEEVQHEFLTVHRILYVERNAMRFRGIERRRTLYEWHRSRGWPDRGNTRNELYIRIYLGGLSNLDKPALRTGHDLGLCAATWSGTRCGSA